MDGNNQIIPIATGVSQGETGESWTWFLRKLKECIGEVPNLTIISDRHYAISLACNNVFPNAFHGYCCRHLMMNCGMQSDNLKKLYWKTCKAYSREDFEKLMNDIQTVKPDAHQKLVDAGVEKWSRAMCPANRYNYMTSNSVESINALTKDVQKIPITSLMDWFRDLLQDWFYERRQKYEDIPDDDLTPWASAKIRYRYLKSSSWSVKGILKWEIYEVRDNERIHKVYLKKGICTCRRWQLSVLPCGHVCAIARVEGVTSVTNLAKPWFLSKTLKATYAGLFFPVTDISTWETPNEIQQVLPPNMAKKQLGRPKNRDRIRSQGEGPIINKCGRCGVKGHNRTTCNVPLPSIQRTFKKKQRCTQDAECSQGNNYQTESHNEGNNEVFQQNNMYEPQYDTSDMGNMYHTHQENTAHYYMYQQETDYGINGLSQWLTQNNFLN